MSTYKELVGEVRAIHPALSRAALADRAIITHLWRGAQNIVREAAELSPSDSRLPRTVTPVSVPADLTSAMSLPASMVKHVAFEVVYSNNYRLPLTVVPSSARWDEVDPVPAAYIQGSNIYAIPAAGKVEWNHANILAAGWTNATTLNVESIPIVASPTADTTTFPLDALFESACIHYAARKVAVAHNASLVQALDALYGMEKEDALTSLVRSVAGREVVREVY